MGKSASDVRSEIEDTRQDMSETIDAIADRTSPRRVVARRRARMANGWRSVRERVMGQADDVRGTVGDRAQGLAGSAQDRASGVAEQARRAPEMVVEQTQGNPLAAGLIAFGGGLLLASLLPPTEAEQRVAGKVREQTQPLQDELARAGQAVGEDLKSSAQEAAEQVKQRAAEATSTVGDDVRSSAGELTQEARR
jgi:gas vesicle protein